MSDEDLRVPAPGGDPDSRQRLAKTLVAAGMDKEDLPDGLSTEPVTDEDREDAVQEAAAAEERRTAALDKANAAADKAQAAADRKYAAGESQVGKTTAPQGRSTTPKSKTD